MRRERMGKPMNKSNQTEQKGFALVVALSFLVLMTLVATGVLAFGQHQMHTARRTRDYLKAKVIAETGLNVAFNDIRGDIERVENYTGAETEFGDGTYAVTIEEVGESEDENVRFLRITSVGQCGISEAGAALAVRHTSNTTNNLNLALVLLNALTCQKQIVLKGNVSITGDIASATSISTSGNAFDVDGTGYTPSFSGRAARFSDGVNTSDPTRLSIDWGDVLEVDKYIARAVTYDGRPFSSYPANTIVYCPNDVMISGGTIQCMIISDNDIHISGNATLLQPGTYPVLVSLNGTITITGTPEVNGFVVSLSGSEAMGKVSGTPVINGSLFIMGGVRDCGNVEINYLPLDIRLSESDDLVEVIAWQ